MADKHLRKCSTTSLVISKVYKEFKKLDTRESNNPIKKWGKDLNKTFSI